MINLLAALFEHKFVVFCQQGPGYQDLTYTVKTWKQAMFIGNKDWANCSIQVVFTNRLVEAFSNAYEMGRQYMHDIKLYGWKAIFNQHIAW